MISLKNTLSAITYKDYNTTFMILSPMAEMEI